MFQNLDRPAIIAHRGSKAYAPENTMAAFRMAVAQSADAIEFDVKFTKDRKIIIIHDQTVDRTTNGTGKVKDLSWMDFQSLDAGKFFSSQFEGEQIPLLQDVLIELSNDIICNIEITNYSTIRDGLAKDVANMVKDLGLKSRVFFSSFHPINLMIVRRILPEVPAALLCLPGKVGWLARSGWLFGLSPKIIHPYYSDVDKQYIKKQHDRMRSVNVWTVNDLNEMRELISYNVDGLITDDPLLAKSALENS